jgi:two-component system, response regulator PdtaR
MTSGTSLDRAPRIVVAEDDPQLRMLVVDVLTDAGLEALEAARAHAALRIRCSAEGDIQALFTDVNMPGSMNGLELARRAHHKWPRLPLMIGSGAAPDTLPPSGRFVSKPYKLSDLPDRMWDLIAAA